MSEAAEAIGGEVSTEPTIEDRAHDMGWRPQAEFKGDPEKWVDAETFVKRGEEVLPILRANSKKDREALDAAKAEIAEMKKTFAEFRQYHSKTEQRAFAAARKELERELAEAVEAKDHRAVREITAEMADLSKDVRTDDGGHEYQSPDHAKTLNQWKGDNPWYGSDRIMTAAANAIADELEAAGVKGADQMAEVSKRIIAEFPQKFPEAKNERRAAPAAVEGSTPVRKGGKSRADLPPDARQTMDRWVKQGLITEAQYLKDYFA